MFRQFGRFGSRFGRQSYRFSGDEAQQMTWGQYFFSTHFWNVFYSKFHSRQDTSDGRSDSRTGRIWFFVNSYKRRKKGTISKLGYSNRCYGWLQKITRNYFTKYDWIFGKFQIFLLIVGRMRFAVREFLARNEYWNFVRLFIQHYLQDLHGWSHQEICFFSLAILPTLLYR